MHFTTYEDMKKAIANLRLVDPDCRFAGVEFIDAMVEVFERELELARKSSYDQGYDDGQLYDQGVAGDQGAIAFQVLSRYFA